MGKCLSDNFLAIGGGNGEVSALALASASVGSKPRYGSVDVLKGLAILLVVWSHTDCIGSELWKCGTFSNIAFFFLSGFFFKVNAPFGEFMSRRVWRLLLPFFLFYVLSIPFRYVTDLWDYRSFTVFDWSRIWDIFKVEAESDYLSLNVPLWFLFTIFWIQLFGFFVMRLPKWCVLVVGLAALFFGPDILDWPTAVMFNNACYWFGFFAVGYVVGRPLLKVLSDYRWRLITLVFGLVVCVGLVCFLESNGANGYFRILVGMAYLAADVALLAVGSFIEDLRVFRWLLFYGESSLFILGAHLFVLNPLARISYKVTRIHDPWLGLACVVLTALILVPVIGYAKRRWPMLTGDWRP